jgi:hypothetical protein
VSDPDLERAYGYPYAPPEHSFLYVAGEAFEIVDPGRDPLRDGVIEIAGELRPAAEFLRLKGLVPGRGAPPRVPMLAVGSNRAPTQLARKFAAMPDTVIPVTRARLADFDVVYSAHLSLYGALPATLAAAPGTVVSVAVVWLTPDQLARMDETEGVGQRYERRHLADLFLTLETGALVEEIEAYVSLAGALVEEDAPVALAAVAADNRPHRELDQREALDLVRRRLAPELTLDEFVRGHVEDERLRLARSTALARTARALAR